MREIKFELRYCHGINELKYTFKFNKKKPYVIYAPNGTMKTSFTKTLQDLREDRESMDEVFLDRESKRIINNELNQPLEASNVLVFESYKDNYEADNMTNLLVSEKLKKQYDSITNKLEENKIQFLKVIEKKSGVTLRKGLETILMNDLNGQRNELFDCLQSQENNKEELITPLLCKIKYIDIINDNVKKFLDDQEVRRLLKEYMEKYNQLFENSIFKKGIFNHSNAEDIGKNLQDNGYFKANYNLLINNKGEEIKISDKKGLEELVKKAKNQILEDDDLAEKFDKIDQKIKKNKENKKLRDILEEYPELIVELTNYDELKKKFWVSYIFKDDESLGKYNTLISNYNDSKEKIKAIIEKAKNEKTQWEGVINLFNNRFDVPFKVGIGNQEDVILKESRPSLIFTYLDPNEEKNIDKNKLINVLSRGEQRALYILNIIFEIKGIENEGEDILLVFDDIADSFDYKNKYAIIEYLKEISEEMKFNMIILTHNFDFYRTIGNRLNARCLMTKKSEEKIEITEGKYIKDIFLRWKTQFATNDKILISAIPFIRNISEYILGSECAEYKFLTCLLHIKQNPKTKNIRVCDIQNIYKKLWQIDEEIDTDERYVYSIIMEQAEAICDEPTEELDLENKITLSIAIRLLAEEYMINRINDMDFVSSITGVQTGKLLGKFKETFKGEIITIKLLEKVNLMTSENIHLNSFMYEPLLDISENHLKSLYLSIKALIKTIEITEAQEEAAPTQE
ncbi:MAG: hypothetical protein E6300_16655 [Clostridium sp.]|uniref:hypothetical protein n=1 Tax=Clostridium sp. TaxID=1506 RepID=UPI0029133C8B|nr:hypothetical protein [Clostridium sp.]MDU7150108.1 hypothetical protein [Clostridium sp.]